MSRFTKGLLGSVLIFFGICGIFALMLWALTR
jgi:hypothetical protein